MDSGTAFLHGFGYRIRHSLPPKIREAVKNMPAVKGLSSTFRRALG